MKLLNKYFVFFLSATTFQFTHANSDTDPFYRDEQIKKTTPETRAVVIAISSVKSLKKVGMLTNLRDQDAGAADFVYHMHRYILDKTNCKKAKILTFNPQYHYPSEYVLLDIAVLVDERIRALKESNCKL